MYTLLLVDNFLDMLHIPIVIPMYKVSEKLNGFFSVYFNIITAKLHHIGKTDYDSKQTK
jgi:hypothetical protein